MRTRLAHAQALKRLGANETWKQILDNRIQEAKARKMEAFVRHAEEMLREEGDDADAEA
jgi:hypothetical protein